MGLSLDVAKALKTTRDMIQDAKRDNSRYTDFVRDAADENSFCIEDLADIIADLDARVTALEDAGNASTAE